MIQFAIKLKADKSADLIPLEAKVIVRLGFGLTTRIIVITIQKSLGSPSTSPIV
jgi:hypothetical protein